jgi:ubiquinone/menaquinone biosynthesis C-methylase UbiE
MTLEIIAGIGLVALILVFLIWRPFSRRSSLPCPFWLGWLVELDNPLAKSNKARTIIEQLDLREGMRVLDAGCGPGRVAIPLAKLLGKEGEVVAMDLQSEMLHRAEEKALAAGLENIRFLQAGIGEGRAGQGQYDRVLLVTVLGEIPDQRKALREIYDALKPGGILSVTETLFDPHFQRRARVLELATPMGFQEKSTSGNWLAFTINLQKPLST